MSYTNINIKIQFSNLCRCIHIHIHRMHSLSIWDCCLSFVNGQSLAILHNSISFLFPLTDHLQSQPWTHCQPESINKGKNFFFIKTVPMCECFFPSLTWCTPDCILRESRPHAIASNPFFTAGNFIETSDTLVNSFWNFYLNLTLWKVYIIKLFLLSLNSLK